MIAIIAEKPSLARNIVSGIGEMTKKNGYYENSKYIVTWAFGHLFSLCDIEDYQEANQSKNVKWTLDNLPCFPHEFRFKLKSQSNGKSDSIKEQFQIIQHVLNRDDVTQIVNAGDSDREGEIIIRLCVYNALKKSKPFFRLWLPDQTPQTVKKALSEMKSENEYDNLANEGFARTYIDWLYGVNLTRYATIKTGTLLRVGRVIVPIVKAIYDRDKEIENFTPEKYYALVSQAITNGEIIELTSKYKFGDNELEKAQKCCDRMNLLPATVKDKSIKNEILYPGKLYSLTKLQNYLGRKHKMPMEKSLSIAQKLYENGFISYPRTNSEYLATNEKDKIKKIISDISSIGYPICFKNSKTIFDDSKIESHSALTPTYKVPKKDSLTSDEYIVYQAIFRRFIAVFCKEDCLAQKTEIVISLGGKEDYTLKGMVITSPGWTKYEIYDRKDKILPNLNINDKVNINFKPQEKQTQPPKHYTIETLNNYLKNPFKDEKNISDDNDDDDYNAIFKGLELGTEATRTGIIDNAKKSGYISLKKDIYHIEKPGKFLIESLTDMNISMDKYKTSQLGQALKKVYRSEITIDDSVKIAQNEVSEIFRNGKIYDTGSFGEIIGVCPICKKDIVKGKFAYGCMGYKNGCKFKINIKISGRIITIDNAKSLLQFGKTNLLEFTSKTNKKFNAKLILSQENDVVFEF